MMQFLAVVVVLALIAHTPHAPVLDGLHGPEIQTQPHIHLSAAAVPVQTYFTVRIEIIATT